MHYVILIYWDDSGEGQLLPAEREAQDQAYRECTLKMQQAGIFRGEQALQASFTATTLSKPDGRLIISDGPFAQTKEQLGRFYLVDCEDLDEAIQWATLLPHARNGIVEIRPVAAL